MLRLAYCTLAVISLCGCAGPQLRESAVDMGPSFGSLQERQILDNLSALIRKPWTIPGQIDVTTGSLQVQNQASLVWKVPIASTGHEADPSAQSQEQDSFTFTPVTDGDDLRRVRALYRYAICADPKAFATDWEETIKPYEEALLNTSVIAALPGAEAEIRRLDNSIRGVDEALRKKRAALQNKAVLSRPKKVRKGEFSPRGGDVAEQTIIVPDAERQRLQADIVSLTKQKTGLQDQKKAAQAKTATKDTSAKSSDQSGPPDSVQLERAREHMIIASLGTSRFLYWTDEGSKISRFAACPVETSERAAAPGAQAPYHLGSYGGLDLWTDRPDIFSKFMIFVIGSTPNTTGIHALTLGVPGNAPPKVLNSTPTLRILGGVL